MAFQLFCYFCLKEDETWHFPTLLLSLPIAKCFEVYQVSQKSKKSLPSNKCWYELCFSPRSYTNSLSKHPNASHSSFFTLLDYSWRCWILIWSHFFYPSFLSIDRSDFLTLHKWTSPSLPKSSDFFKAALILINKSLKTFPLSRTMLLLFLAAPNLPMFCSIDLQGLDLGEFLSWSVGPVNAMYWSTVQRAKSRIWKAVIWLSIFDSDPFMFLISRHFIRKLKSSFMDWWYHLSRRAEWNKFLRFLPISTILWFCDIHGFWLQVYVAWLY